VERAKLVASTLSAHCALTHGCIMVTMTLLERLSTAHAAMLLLL
jgi:hypothetical protein